ncbi:hypothetical protein [Enterobacter cloacae]|uniref:hypothetical protein n=1 Tax=Enterobacter cloacae TaxID=550 RepID=UPI003314756B
MSTLTKQWLQQKISDMEATRDEIPFGLDEDDSNTLAALRIALASLEAKPVSVNDDMAYAFHHAISDSSLGSDEVEEIKTGLRAAFANVTAPPAPASDSLLSELLGIAKRAADEADECAHAEFSDDSMKHSAAIVDWERRAAMLQGADGNSPVIPDCSEDTKRLDWLEAQNKRLNEYYGTTYGWKFDANFQRNAMMLNDSNYPVMTVRQAIDEAIAAAPQQEANNG